MDKIEFKKGKDGYWGVFVNGKRINQLLEDPNFLTSPPLNDVALLTYLGKLCHESESDIFGKRVPILVCASCGFPGCEGIIAYVYFEGSKVIWKDFSRVSGEDIIQDYNIEFTFDRNQYMKEIMKLIKEIKLSDWSFLKGIGEKNTETIRDGLNRADLIRKLKGLSRAFLDGNIDGKVYSRTTEGLIATNIKLVPELEEFADFLAQYEPKPSMPELYSDKDLKKKIKKVFKI